MRSGLGTRNLYAVVHYDAQQQRRFCHADNITRHTDSENLMTEFYISEFSFKIGAVVKFCFQTYRRTVWVFLNNCFCQSKRANDVPAQRDNRKKARIRVTDVYNGKKRGPECQPQCRNRQHKLIQQRLMLSFDYRTHAVKTEKRKL